jgi:hypothetical protein
MRVAVIAVLALLCTQDEFPAGLAAISPNSWLDLGLPWRGGHEVPACFDQANRLFFKYGGCGDHSERIHLEGSKRPDETYGNSCWVVNLATGKWEMRRPRDQGFPKDRPANGCSRNYCYDSSRKVIWMYGGISNGGGGGDPWDFWAYDGKTNAFTQANSKGRPRGGDDSGGDVFAYDPIHDLIVMPRGPSTWVYQPGVGSWEERKTPDAPPGPGHYGSITFDVAARRLVYPVNLPTGKTADERPEDTDTTYWRHSDRTKKFHEYAFQTWTYDPAEHVWANLRPPQQPPPRGRFGLAYDSKNKVVILIGGSTDTWDDHERYFNDVWVLTTGHATWTKMNPPPPLPKGHEAWRDCRQCAYDELDNVALWQPPNGHLWAYRYK